VANADRIIELLHEAKIRPAGAQRARFLDEACGHDSALMEQIVSLLEAEADEGNSDFLKITQSMRPSIPPTEKPGDWIGRYKLLEQIGEGGCGVVYMAEQQEPVRRRVALKVIKLGMDTRQVIARFEGERQALAMMDHPNIAKVLDGGATDTGRPFFVMELVGGIKITDYCDQNHLSTRERLELFIQVCQAIQHAHQKGIIHRDIKPSNILVTDHDDVAVPKVIDFGISKATIGQLTDQTVFTAFAQFVGTPAYMSPEQAQLSGLDIDTRADIYSLGVLLYELLTGNAPFDAKKLLAAGMDEMRRKIREDEPARPSTSLSTMTVIDLTTAATRRHVEPPKLIHLLRGDLDWLVMKCLEKDRTRRYQTASALAMDLQRHLNDEPVIARPPSHSYRFQKLVRRNKLAFAAGGAVAVALILALVTLAMSNARIRQERNQKDIALEAAQASELQRREQLFVSLQSQAQARRYSHQTGQRLESLAALTEAARIRPTPELRDSAIAAMAMPDVETGPVRGVPDVGPLHSVYDSRYEHYAYLRKDGTISICTVPDNHEVQRLESIPSTRTGVAAGLLRFSPDGRFIAKLVENGELQVWQWESGESVLKSSRMKCSGAPAFSPDTRRLAVGHEGWITCFDLNTGEANRRWQARGGVYRLDFHPDSRMIAVGYFETNVVSIYDADDGSHLADLPAGTSSLTTVAWHPEGNLLATGGSDPRIQIWDVAARRQVAIFESRSQQVSALMFHPGGDLLISTSLAGVGQLWQASPGRLLMRIPPSSWLGFSPGSGRWVGAVSLSDHEAQTWGIVPSQEYHTFLNPFPESESTLSEGDISADGNVLALAGSDGVRLWDVARGREIARLPIGDTTCTMFRDDGRELLTCGTDDGLRRWSILTSTGTKGGLQLGPFHQIELPFVPLRMARGRDDRMLAVVGEEAGQCVMLDLVTESVRVTEMPHLKAGFIALSPDGKRVASGGWHSESVKLWDAPSGKLVKELDAVQGSRVFFTPDNRELLVARGNVFTFHTLDSLAMSRRLPREAGLYPGIVAFTTDGKMMALEMAPGVIHLQEVASGRTVARLEDPQGDVSSWLSFSPDGTQLIIVARYSGTIHRWDLRAIRERLKPMGLDWDWPAFSAAETAGPVPSKDRR
jgi:serine/threonine protein kinase/WD40 repeat protein